MNALSRFVELAKGEPRADYAVVYLEEAHPTNGWMYPAVEHHIVQHTVVAERVAAAQILRRELDKLRAEEIPVYVDNMDNEASRMFGALPERLAIVLDGKVEFIGGRGPEDYSIPQASEALAAILDDLHKKGQ